MMFNKEHIAAIWDSMYVSFGIVMFVAAFVFTVLMMWWKRLIAPFLIAFIGIPALVYHDVIPTYLTYERLNRTIPGYKVFTNIEQPIDGIAVMQAKADLCGLSCIHTLLNSDLTFVETFSLSSGWDLEQMPLKKYLGFSTNFQIQQMILVLIIQKWTRMHLAMQYQNFNSGTYASQEQGVMY